MSQPRPLFVGPLLHLRTLPPLESLPQANLVALANETEEVIFQRGTWLIGKGEPVSALFLILDGLVSTEASGDSVQIGPGGAIGFLEALSAVPTPGGVRAESDGVALRLETDALRDICDQDFQVLLALLGHVAERARHDIETHYRCVRGASPGQPPEPIARLDRVGRILALHRTPAFPSRSMDALAELAGHLVEVRHEAGAVLWEIDDPAEGFYVVCDGSVDLHDTAGGQRTLGAGSVPGMLSTLSGAGHQLRVTARTASTLLHVAPEPFFDVLEDHFEMAFDTLGRIAATLLAVDGSDESGV